MGARPFDGCHAGAGSPFFIGINELDGLADFLRGAWADQQGGKSRILFCNPVKSGRSEGTVRLSYDEGKTWPVAKIIHKDYFGYSCLAAMPDGAMDGIQLCSGSAMPGMCFRPSPMRKPV